MPANALALWLGADKHRCIGEFALAIHPQVASESIAGEGERILKLLLPELPTKTAVKLAADITGEPRNALYDLALKIKNEDA